MFTQWRDCYFQKVSKGTFGDNAPIRAAAIVKSWLEEKGDEKG